MRYSFHRVPKTPWESKVNPNQRRPNEPFKAYRARLKAQHQVEREHQPRVLWNSLSRGTYVRKVHSPLL